MNADLIITGMGAVSPAGWGMGPLRDAIRAGVALPAEDGVRRVPRGGAPAELMRHPRLRRASPLSHFAAAAAVEALGTEPRGRVGLICSLINGCVVYSGKFYGEVLENPATASPILFPETVFNAPASHLATLLGLDGPVVTLVGDTAQFLAALEVAQMWLEMDLVDACLVVGAEEADPLTVAGLRMFSRGSVLGEGAGAVVLERTGVGVKLSHLELHPMTSSAQRPAVVRKLLAGHPIGNALLLDDASGNLRRDAVWQDCPALHLSPLRLLGEGLGAAAAWQTVLGAALIADGDASAVRVIATGSGQQAGSLVLY